MSLGGKPYLGCWHDFNESHLNAFYPRASQSLEELKKQWDPKGIIAEGQLNKNEMMMRWDDWEIIKGDGALGTCVLGADLKSVNEEVAVTYIKELLFEHRMLVFRDQTLTPLAHEHADAVWPFAKTARSSMRGIYQLFATGD